MAEKADWEYNPIPRAVDAYRRGDFESAELYYWIAAEMGYEVAQSNLAWLMEQSKSVFDAYLC